ncbi:MAG: hypothetical protein IPP49_18950 [Saprospiraceae bacterium]|nr:hypothetical protein [Saprospiraceae bacterium]
MIIWDPLIIRTDHRGCGRWNYQLSYGENNRLNDWIEDEISDDDKMVISPNPAQDHIDITISDGMALPLRYEVKTISGHRVEVGTHSSTNVLSIAVMISHQVCTSSV